jgi:flagellar basal body-associated protein FliL
MQKTVLENTTLEQMPISFGRIHGTTSKIPWAIIIITVIAIAFGIFWFFEQSKIDTTKQVESANISTNIDSLQAALANTVVPNLADTFNTL